jgi:hypothetical protein
MKRTQAWITKNFESLVSSYGGRYIGVVNEKVIAVAMTPKEVIEQAKRGGEEEEDVSLLKVPTEEELICVL